MSLSYCTLVTDVLLSQYPDLHYLADDRLLEAVAVLKEAKKPKQKVEVTKPIIVAPTVVVEEEKTEAKEENKPEDAMEQDIPVATTTVEESAAIPEETALESVEAKVDEVDDSKTGNVVEDETPENAEDEADGDEEMMQDVEDPANDVSSDYQKMSLEEANIWRTRFIVACKYFDTNHEKFLRADILKMIVSSSLR